MSAQSQLGIKVKARFVRALRKGIYSIPPFMCTAVCICFPLLFCPSSPHICLSPFFLDLGWFSVPIFTYYTA